MVDWFASSVAARNTVVVQHHITTMIGSRSWRRTATGARQFACDTARRNVDVIVDTDRDGTLNEVATGIAGTNAALGVLAVSDVFARTIGLPTIQVAAVDLLAGDQRRQHPPDQLLGR